MQVPEFLDAHASRLAESSLIRMVGTRYNAALILGLRQRFSASPPKIVLANPYICRTKAARRSPSDVLLAMWQPEASSRLPGCWHTLSETDCITYAMCDEFERNKGVVTTRLFELAAKHPAWPVITFIPDHHREAACVLLMLILDPRWYTHPSRPHRFSKVHAHLGITPKNTRNALEHMPVRQGGWNYSRVIAALLVWFNLDSLRTFEIGDATTPSHFLWEVYKRGKSKCHGASTATKRLVNLICYVWTEAVVSKQADHYFQPSSFFRTMEECVAFQEHLVQPPDV